MSTYDNVSFMNVWHMPRYRKMIVRSYDIVRVKRLEETDISLLEPVQLRN